MSGVKIKICGLSRPEDIETVNRYLPEYIGFVFWEKSKRNVSPEQAEMLRKQLDPRITPVGVFVDAEISFVADLLNRGIIEIAQLHGKEDDAYIRELRKQTNKPCIKAFVIRSDEDLRQAAVSEADHILLDNGKGTGDAFDWNLIGAKARPFFLAGGIHPGNVREALAYRPYAIDTSSGVETDGKKDPEKIRKIIEIVREENNDSI